MNERIALCAGRRTVRTAAGPSSDQAEWAILHSMGQWLIRDRCWSVGDEEVADRMLETSHRSKRQAKRREHHEVAALLAHGRRGRVALCRFGRRIHCGGREERETAQTVDDTHPLALPSRLVEIRHHACHALAHLVRHIQKVIQRPVQVIGQKPDLLPEAVGSDRRYSPSAPPPPTSTMTVSPQCGQMTSAIVVPSVLIRR
ncbi:unannotated protein [freshwater metagenome]|uniref:Unannotated protein n=1 Tax=freshwater metagenome TaxID=449393 RepID=A0A6J7J3W6_9ZZZZ